MKKSFLILLLGCFSFSYGQNLIKGIVSDEHNKPIQGVQIYIQELHTGTTTNEGGEFELGQIPNGSHQILFNHLGYDIEIIQVLLTNETIDLKVNLYESVFHMDEIIVSTPFHKIQNENVMRVDYKNINALSRNGGISLVQNLTSIPGVEEISTGSGIGKPVIRGLSGNRVLVYTQGVRLENQQYGDEHGLGINGSGIRSPIK